MTDKRMLYLVVDYDYDSNDKQIVAICEDRDQAFECLRAEGAARVEEVPFYPRREGAS